MPLTRDDAVSRIQNLLGYTTARTAEIQNALQDAQLELEQDAYLPWFLLTDASVPTQLVTVASSRAVALPTGFLREYEDDALYYLNADDEFIPLEKDELEYLNTTFLATSGVPQAYAITLSSFIIFPLPDAVYNLRINQYYKADAILSSNITNQWLTYTHELIIGEAGMKIAPGLRDSAGISIFKSMAIRGKKRLISGSEAREHANRRYIMGGPD